MAGTSKQSPDSTHHRFLVLHGLKLKGIAEPAAIGAVTGLDEGAVSAVLPALQGEELVLRRDGRLSGWTLTAGGRAAHVTLLHDEINASGHRDDVEARYREFLVLNADLLAVCTAWQVRDLEANELNDHLDPDYDAEVIGRLKQVDVGVRPICDDLTGRLTRYANYAPRYDVALQKVDQGLTEWFARPIIDSYHTVWMEMHEDLLATLAIDRASEGSH